MAAFGKKKTESSQKTYYVTQITLDLFKGEVERKIAQAEFVKSTSKMIFIKSDKPFVPSKVAITALDMSSQRTLLRGESVLMVFRVISEQKESSDQLWDHVRAFSLSVAKKLKAVKLA